MTLDFQTFNLTQKAEGGGGSGTTNHAQLSNLDYANSGHTGFMSDENFIPNNTIITVELDGSGDYTNLSDAVNYLTGKWSNGTVTIQLGEGTFDVSGSLVLDGDSFNTKALFIQGQGIDKTIIRCTGSSSHFLTISRGDYKLTDLAIIKDGTKNGNGIFTESNTLLHLDNVLIKNFSKGLSLDLANCCHIMRSLQVEDCTTGVSSFRLARLITNVGAIISFKNATTAWSVSVGGMIATSTPVTNITYTNVTTKCSQTVGTFTSSGYIGGTLQN